MSIDRALHPIIGPGFLRLVGTLVSTHESDPVAVRKFGSETLKRGLLKCQ